MSSRKYSPEFKARVALESLRGDISQAGICRRYGIGADQLSQWRKRLIEQAPKLFQMAEVVIHFLKESPNLSSLLENSP